MGWRPLCCSGHRRTSSVGLATALSNHPVFGCNGYNRLLLAVDNRTPFYRWRQQSLQLILVAPIGEAREPPYDEGLRAAGGQVA